MNFEEAKNIIIETLKIKNTEEFEKDFKDLMLDPCDFVRKEKKYNQLINKYRQQS
jgi:hypothetical protein